ncbi:MAG: hypothetical protein LIR50_06750 [Bacillota bacterium]|nr:hypothetical protein [Bacillota bacterium]
MRKVNKKFLFPIVVIVMALILAYLVFKIAYTIFISKSYSSYEGTIKAYVTKIDNINDIQFNEELNTKNISALVKTLDEKISGLTKIKSQIASLSPSDKYRSQHESLVRGIETNILIYKQTEGILNNPKGSDLDNSAKSLGNYRDKTKTSYSDVLSLSKISLPKDLLAFIDKIIEFSNENSRINKDNEIKSSQKEDFISSTSEVINSFINLKKDYYTEAYNARNADGNLANVLVSINSNKASFKSVKSSFAAISVPGSDANSTYNSLKALLNSYDSYLQSISFSVNTEIAKEENSNSTISAAEIDSIYNESKAAYSLVNEKYNTFVSDLENYKNKK